MQICAGGDGLRAAARASRGPDARGDPARAERAPGRCRSRIPARCAAHTRLRLGALPPFIFIAYGQTSARAHARTTAGKQRSSGINLVCDDTVECSQLLARLLRFSVRLPRRSEPPRHSHGRPRGKRAAGRVRLASPGDVTGLDCREPYWTPGGARRGSGAPGPGMRVSEHSLLWPP